MPRPRGNTRNFQRDRVNSMKILRESCLSGAGRAEGIAVVIDVFRAFSCAPLLFHFDIGKLFLEPDPDRALSLKTDDGSGY